MNDNVIEFVEQDDFSNVARIKVIGVGGEEATQSGA